MTATWRLPVCIAYAAICISLGSPATADTPPVLLTPGQPVNGVVNPRQYAYYDVAADPAGKDLTIAVTPLAGDPDLYISIDVAKPTSSHYTWSRAHLGGDTVTIASEDSHGCKTDPSCKYHIGVFGYAGSTFTLLASYQNSEPTTLTLGQPQEDSVDAGAFKQYALNITADVMTQGGVLSDLQVVVRPSLGDADLFVTLDGQRPMSEHYQYRSASWGDTEDRVVIRRNDSQYRTHCVKDKCVMRAAVFGFHGADYSIVASTYAEATALQPGVPQQSTLPPGTYQRFTTLWPTGADDMLISFSPQSGQPRLFASCRTSYPNASDHDWSLDLAGGLSSSILRINASDATARGCAIPTTLTVSVYGDSLSSFTLLASTNASSAVPLLVPGVQLSGTVKGSAFQYYQIRVGADYVDVDVILTVRTGEVDLYVSGSYEARPVYDSAAGAVTNYTLKSTSDGDDRLSIKHSHFGDCSDGKGCYYIVGVWGRGGRLSSNDFTIVAKKQESTITLQDGVAVRDFVGPHMYEFFRIKVVDPAADLCISVTPFSGDPDLYVGVPPITRPTKENHTWASRGFGADTLTLQAEVTKQHCTPDPGLGVGCDYYIGVYGWTNTSFSIVATLGTGWKNPILLLSSQPQSGHVSKGGYQYYQYFVRGDGHSPSIHITLTPNDGSDQDLYATLSRDRSSAREPGKKQYDFKSTTWDSIDEVVISPSSEHYCTDCYLFLSVFGYEEGSYSLQVSLSTEQTGLLLGMPVRGTVAPSSYVYYVVDWQTQVNDLVLELTPESGHPTAYASCSDPFPSSNSTWSLNTRSTHQLRLNSSDATEHGCHVPGKLWVAVYSESALCSFSILVSAEASMSVPMLVSGVQISGSVKHNAFQYYQVRMAKAYVNTNVIATVRAGEVDLYVSDSYEGRPQYDPTRGVFNYTLSSANPGDDSIMIEPSHFGSCNPDPLLPGNGSSCYFIVGVLGKAYSKNDFTIVARSEDSTVTLRDGVPIRDVVGPHKYAYFKIKVVDPTADLSLSVTPFSGDPDLYLGMPPLVHPTKENHTWASRGFGADNIMVQAGEMKPHCTPDPHSGVGCDVYIGVYGWTNTSFSIVATLGTGWENPVVLTSGHPQSGHVAKGSYQYYQFYVSESTEGGVRPVITMTLTPTQGTDQDLYVTMGSDREPGKNQYDFKSTAWGDIDEVVIRPGMERYCTGCTVSISVFGYQEGRFQLVASLDSDHTALQLDVPLQASVSAHSVSLYSVQWPSQLVDLVIALTPESGRPKVYASCKEQVPNATTPNTWALDTAESSLLRINATDAKRAGCGIPTVVYLAVRGMAAATSAYTILASTDASSSVPMLVPGMQVSGSVKRHRFKYFQVRLGDEYVDMDVILTVRTGEVDLYVSDSYEGRPQYNASGVYNYTLSSENEGSDHIVIKQSHFKGCTKDCYYVVGVFGRGSSGSNRFMIVAKKLDSTVTLQDGVPIRDFVAPQQYSYYRVTVVDSTADLSLSVTPFSGDPDLYVSVPPIYRPTKKNHTWASRGFGADTLTLQAEDMKQHCNTTHEVSCDFYIGVYGWSNTSFSLMASLSRGWDSPMVLLPGQPQTGHVDKQAYQYYSFFVPEGATTVRFSLTSTADTDQDLYLSTSRDKEPGRSQYDLKSTTWAGSDEIVFSAEEAGDKFCSDCTVYLSVYGYMAGDFTVSVDAGLTTLQSAVPVTGHVSSSSMTYYKLYNSNPLAHVVVSVTTLSGDPDIYMTRSRVENGTTVYPDRNNYMWRSNRVGDDTVEVLPSDPNFCSSCEYVVGVYGWANTSYVVTGTVEELFVIPLADGRPQSGHVGGGDLRYFSVGLGNSAEDLRVSLTLLSGSAELYVADGLDMQKLPTPHDSTSYKYTSRQVGAPEVVVPGPHANRTTFAIGVYGVEDSAFSITASLSQDPVILQEGVPLQQATDAGRTEFFVFTVRNRADVTITVTAIQGDPDVLASTNNTRPMCSLPEGSTSPFSYDCYNYTWISQSFASDSLTILHDVPCEETGDTRVAEGCTADMFRPGKKLYIGVYGYEDTVYTITVTTGGGHTSMVPGRPQHASTRIGIVCPTRTSSGSCDTTSPTADMYQAQVSYFKFRVSPDDLPSDANAHVSLTLGSSCNTTLTPCAPGCSCNPLTAYVRSCVESECTPDDEYPSSFPGGHQISHEADSAYSTLFIARDPLNPHNGYCDARARGQVCYYYVAVMAKPEEDRPASFSLTAATPRDVTVLPTRTHPAPPDGVITSSLDVADGGQGGRKYQMYATQGSSMLVSLEPCTGDVSLAVCDGSCKSGMWPTATDFTYYADATRSCTSGGCVASTSPIPRVSLSHIATDSFFLTVNGSGTYYLKIDTAGKEGGDSGSQAQSIAPLLAPPPTSAVPSVSDIMSDRLTLSWKPAQLSVPGLSRTTVTPQTARYKVFALDERALSAASGQPTPVLHTACGLEHYAALTTFSGGSKVAVTTPGQTSVTMQGLSPGTQYRLVVVALCNADCLRQVSKVTPTSTLAVPCGTSAPCQDQSAVYSPAYVSTLAPGPGAPGDHGRPDHPPPPPGGPLLLVVLLAVVVVTVGAVAYLYRRNRRLERQLQYEMTDTSHIATATVSRSVTSRPAPARPGSRYEPLLQEEEADDSYRRMSGDSTDDPHQSLV